MSDPGEGVSACQPRSAADGPARLRAGIVHTGGGRALVKVHGTLDADTGGELDDALRRAVELAGAGPHIVLDLAGIVAVTGAGLDVLLDHQERVVATGGRVELRDPSDPVVLLLHDVAIRDDPGVGP